MESTATSASATAPPPPSRGTVNVHTFTHCLERRPRAMMRGMLTPPAALHAILFASGEPLAKKDITKLLGLKESELAIALKALIAQLDGHGVSIIETATELELRTAPEAANIVKKLRESELSREPGK